MFVGKTDATPKYYAAVQSLITRFRMPPGRFIFTGPVPDVDLATYYRMASVYISLSEHEGFCVPLLEAMAADVPVLAYSAAAVPDTLGGAGVQFAPKDLDTRRRSSASLPSTRHSGLRSLRGSGGGWPTSATRASAKSLKG